MIPDSSAKTIMFGNNNVARLVRSQHQLDISQALKAIGLDNPQPVIVLVGGAAGVTRSQKKTIDGILERLAVLAQNMGAAVVDGGTDAGIMASIGHARHANRLDFPLVGVAVEELVTWPGLSDQEVGNVRWQPLEPNHSHFILVAGDSWGDESSSLAQIGTELGRGHLNVTLLVNGGVISKQDIAHSLAAQRPVLVLAGTGRLADEIAANPPASDLIKIVPTTELDKLTKVIRLYLTEGNQS